MSLIVSGGPQDELEGLLLDSALAAIDAEAPLDQIEAALRALMPAMAQADPLRRAMVREAAMRRLRAAGVHSPATLLDTAFGGHVPDFHSRIPLPTPWPEMVPGSELLDHIAATLRRFVVLPAAAAEAQALWCLHTYVSDAFAVSPILCVRSPEKRCGKTRNLEILGSLVHRPLHTAHITPAALYRTIDAYRPTLLIDEADTIFVRGGNAELRGLLNAGLYRSTAFVLRCTGKRQEPQLSSVWCPKAIALIGRLPSTLEDRSIVTSLRRRTSAERVDPFDNERVREQLDPIRRKAARWAADHRDRLKAAVPEVPDVLHDRARDLWRVLLAIADVAGGGWPERARRAAEDLSTETLEPLPQITRVPIHPTRLEILPMKTKRPNPASTPVRKARTSGTGSGAQAKSTPTASTPIIGKQRAGRKTASTGERAATARRSRAGTKTAAVLQLLRRKPGATTVEIAKATGWQNHTIRGFISGTVTKRMRLTVESSMNDDGGRTYRIVE
jgi:Protein of unknown function (DUF3631)/Protein of unknown function (DUF3489)